MLKTQMSGQRSDSRIILRFLEFRHTKHMLNIKAGKAIIFHAGGENYSKRHILGAFNLDETVKNRDEMLEKFPKEGIEIFTYCY